MYVVPFLTMKNPHKDWIWLSVMLVTGIGLIVFAELDIRVNGRAVLASPMNHVVTDLGIALVSAVAIGLLIELRMQRHHEQYQSERDKDILAASLGRKFATSIQEELNATVLSATFVRTKMHYHMHLEPVRNGEKSGMILTVRSVLAVQNISGSTARFSFAPEFSDIESAEGFDPRKSFNFKVNNKEMTGQYVFEPINLDGPIEYALRRTKGSGDRIFRFPIKPNGDELLLDWTGSFWFRLDDQEIFYVLSPAADVQVSVTRHKSIKVNIHPLHSQVPESDSNPHGDKVTDTYKFSRGFLAQQGFVLRWRARDCNTSIESNGTSTETPQHGS